MAEFIEFLSKDALKDLQTANAELVTMISNVDKVGTKMKGITTPSGSDSAIKGLTAEYQKQEKIITNLQNKVVKANEVAQRQAEKTRLAEIKLAQQREQAFDKFDKNLAREQAKLNASLNLYNKTQKQLNNITASYNDLITRKLRYNNLSDNEEKRLLTLQRVTERYNTTLKAVDATIGKNQRNVGNYASAFNPLSNSINQLTREMPAFTYSVQTGFMALSNNIPIFTDAISNAIAQNKALQAEGKPTTSVLSQLATSFFSFQTLLGVGITLLTVYGKEIGEWISNVAKGSKAIDSLKESQTQLNTINQEAQKNAVQETLNLKSLLAIAKDTALSYKERMIAVKELQSTYPAYFGNLKQEEILAGNTANAERQLTDAILSRAKANAAVSKITENQAKLIDIEVRKLELQKEQIQAEKDLQREKVASQGSSGGQLITGTNQNQLNANVRLASIRREFISLNKEQNELTQINNTLTSFALENEKESILLKYKDEKATKDKTKAKKEELEVSEKLVENSENAFKKSIQVLEQQLANTDRFSTAYGIINGLLEVQKGIYDQLFGSIKKVNDETKDYIELTDEQVYWDSENKAEDTAKAIIKLRLATEDYIKTLSSDAFNKAFDNIGLSSAKMFLDFDADGQSTFDKLIEGADSMKEKFAVTFQAVGDVAQDVFNKMNEMSNQRFENQRMNLEREYKIGLAFAGDSASARAEIEKQYQERQREIQKKEFKAKKQQALVNIAMDTAQAIIATLAKTPPPLGTGLAIAMGALGAVQAGLVASQQMPQFWKGTDNAPEGWALTQERGREIITDSKGNIKSLGNDKGATMTYLNKGDKVKTASETMDYLMFNNELNAMLTNNSIDKAPSVNIQNTNIDLSPVVKAINDKPVANIGIDKDGLEMYVTSANQTKEVMNRRKTFNGNKV
jgi:ubiquitin